MARNKGFILLLVIVLVLAFMVAWPLFQTLVAACILAYAFFPVHRRLSRSLKNKTVSALLVTVIVALLIIVPLIFVINSLTNQVLVVLSNSSCTSKTVCTVMDFLKGVDPQLPGIKSSGAAVSERAADFASSLVSSIFATASSVIFSLSILFFILYYLIKDGELIAHNIIDELPLRESHKVEMVEMVNNSLYAIIFGNFVVAIIQGLAALVGFFILGVPNPIFWGFVTFIMALIPVFGAFIVWLPASLIMISDGYFGHDSGLIVKGIILLIYGIVFISTIDNILKPKLIGDQANIHPLVVLIGVVGGIAAFGLVGIVLGPLVLAMLGIFFKVAKKEALY